MALLGVTDLWLFIVAGLILNITPGVDLLYITNRSAVQGKKAGIIAALGIGTGCIVHVVAAAFGLSMVLVSSSFAFITVKYLGAAYLFFLGLNTLLSLRHQKRPDTHVSTLLPHSKIFRQAVFINILNPKVALFFMALLPQFVSPSAVHPVFSFLFLGFVFNINGIVVNVLFALFTSILAKKMCKTALLPKVFKVAVGSVFVTFGIRLAYLD